MFRGFRGFRLENDKKRYDTRQVLIAHRLGFGVALDRFTSVRPKVPP